MSKQIMAQKMRNLAKLISKEIPGLGFCLITFEFKNEGIGNYISNAERPEMINLLKETVKRWETNEVFPTAEEN